MAFKTWQKYLLAILPLLVLILLFYYFGDIVSYIMLAWVVSMVGAPFFKLFNKFLGKAGSAAMTLVVLSLLLLLFLRITVPPLINQAKNLSEIDYEKIMSGLDEPIKDMTDWLTQLGIVSEEEENAAELQQKKKHDELIYTEVIKLDSILHKEKDSLLNTNINLLINIHDDRNGDDEVLEIKRPQLIETLRNDFFKMLDPSQIPKLLGSLVGFFGNLMVAILSVFFIAFFFLKEQGLFVKMMSLLVKKEDDSKVQHAIEESTTLLVRYFVGLVIQVLILTFVATVILKLLGFKSALLMAICFAFLNLIPYVGPILGNLVGVLIVISSNLELDFYTLMLPKIITAVVVFAVLQLLDNFLLQPNIFSKSVKAHPLEIFLIVLIGAKLGGILGMVLAIPAYTVIRVLLKVFFSEFEVVKRLTASI